MVHVDCDFLAPGKIGDTLRLGLLVRRIGRSSLQLLIEATVEEVRIASATLTVVLARVDSLRSVPFPPELRSRIQQFLVS